MQVALRARSLFGKLAAAGVAATLACYVFINTAMVIGLVPVVGIPLPMISFGGTAMMTLMAGFAIVLSVDLHRDQHGARGCSGSQLTSCAFVQHRIGRAHQRIDDARLQARVAGVVDDVELALPARRCFSAQAEASGVHMS